MPTINDSTGSNIGAKVNTKNQLVGMNVSLDIESYYSEHGHSYNINTRAITLTSANESQLLYIENTGANPIVIKSLFYLIGTSTGGSGDMYISVYRNPTAGTIIDSTPTTLDHFNRNFGSPNTLTANIYKGGEGETVTTSDGVAIESIFTGPSRAAISVGAIIIPRGSSISVSCTPQSGNSNMDIEIAASLYEDAFDLGVQP